MGNNKKGYNGYYKALDGTERWYKEGKLHRIDGPAVVISDKTKLRINLEYWYIEGICFDQEILGSLIDETLFLGKEKGKHNLYWLKFLTEDEGVQEFPIIPGMVRNNLFSRLFKLIKIKYNEEVG